MRRPPSPDRVQPRAFTAAEPLRAMLAGTWRDLAYAARALAKARAFTIVCVVSLGVGMVPVIAIPYASHAVNVMMTPPGMNTTGLVEIITTPAGPREAVSSWSYPDFMDLRAADTGMALAGWTNGQVKRTVDTPGGDRTHDVSAAFVSADYFAVLGLAPVRGAGLAGLNDATQAASVVMLGNRFWQREFGADADIVGKTLTLDGMPHVVVGVAPPLWVDEREVILPLEAHPLLRETPGRRDARRDRGREWIQVYGRLSPRVSVDQARAAVSAVTSRLAGEYPATNEFRRGTVEAYDPIGALNRRQFRAIQTVALTLTCTVLLVVCLNISGMIQVRSAMRERELSIRQALGASRGRLIRRLLSESFILAALGGILGSVVLFNLPSAIAWLSGNPMTPELRQALRVHPATLAICVGLCFLTTLLCGLLPALRFSRPAVLASLKDDVGAGGRRVGRVHRRTAALQVAIAVPLIVMAGISLDRVRATATAQLGFDDQTLYAAPLNLDGLSIDQAGFQIRRLSAILARTEGVASVTVADGLPLDFRGRMARVWLEVGADTAPAPIAVQVTRVGDGFLDTLGIPLQQGRGFTADDRMGAPPVALISKPLADRLVRGGDAIGKRVIFGSDETTRQIFTIVGVTGDFPTSQMSTTREQMLLPLAQHPGVTFDPVPVVNDEDETAHVMLIARAGPGVPPARMTTALTNVVRERDPEFEPARVVTGTWLRSNSVRDFLVQSAVAGGAGSVILMLAALGIYGVVGLMVATRTREVAVRMALGSSRRRVLALILVDVVKLVLPGAVVGVVLAAALIHLNGENMGVPLSRAEPVAYLAGAAVAIGVAVLASLAPARCAASIQPMIALRSE